MNDSIKIKKTRKEHECEGCAKIIPIGACCYYNTSDEANGEFEHWYLCLICIEYFNVVDWRDGDFFGLGELKSEDPENWNHAKNIVESNRSNEKI